jgi:hypothetical protein
VKDSLLSFLLHPNFRDNCVCQNDTSQSAPTTSQVPAGESKWHVTKVPDYLWLTGLNGNVGVAAKTVPVDASFTEVFDKLNLTEDLAKQFGISVPHFSAGCAHRV